MPDSFTNARPYFDVTFPSSGDGYSISGYRNAFSGLGFLDAIPLQPRAHSPADRKIMVRGKDASSFYNPVYFGDADQRVPFSSGDTPNFSTPASQPRIDIVYITPSGDIKVQQGTEAASPTLPSLSPSGDSRFPICAVWNKPNQTRIVNFENKDASSGDGYIYKDLRPWMRGPGAGAAKLTTSVIPSNTTGDAQAAVGTNAEAARADHKHGGVHAIRKVGSANMQGDVEFAGDFSQSGNRLTFAPTAANALSGSIVQTVYKESATEVSVSAVYNNDDTPPLYSEGNLIISESITPSNATNKIRVTFAAYGAAQGALNAIVFLTDATGSDPAIQINAFAFAAANIRHPLSLTKTVVAGGTGAITFYILGAVDASVLDVAAASFWGGAAFITLTLEEIKS